VILLLLVFISTGILAAPQQGFGPGKQDWGYVDVRPGAHMFWWLHYTSANVNHYTDRPLIIWLQGGPGKSSTGYGNFEELGSLDLYLNERNFTWIKNYNVLFVDSPVGSGFSYVDYDSALTTDNRQIANDLVEMLRDFYKNVPEFEKVPLHIFTESYGGKMAPEFAYVLQQEVNAGKIKCNLISTVIANPWISPIDTVLSWAPYLLQTGNVDIDGYKRIHEVALQTKEAVDAGRWKEAHDLQNLTEYIMIHETDGVDINNILKPIYKNTFKDLTHFKEDRDAVLKELMNGKVKSALKIPKNVTWGIQKGKVYQALEGDFMKDGLHAIIQLLDETDIKVGVITGQLDLSVANPSTVKWVNQLKWKGLSRYLSASRTSVTVGNYIEGYQRKYRNFGLYWVNRAGHTVPPENPKFMDYVLTEMTGIKPVY